jgi:hypothetical protein
MTGVGDGASYSIPLERMPRLPSEHLAKKKRREAGECRIAARSSEHGEIVRNLYWHEQGLCQAMKPI